MAGTFGFLMVMMEPSPAMEDEFNDWYDMEHVPERLRLDGFLSGRRFVCLSGWPRYLAFYDLTSKSVLESSAYRAASWGGFSPWTKRILARVRGQYRASGDQLLPGEAVTGNMGRLTLLRFRLAPDCARAQIEAGVMANYSGRRETLQIRLMRSDYNQQIDYLALIEARAPFTGDELDISRFGNAAQYLDVINEYSPYWQRGYLPGVFPQTP